jgi:hypothetical protein
VNSPGRLRQGQIVHESFPDVIVLCLGGQVGGVSIGVSGMLPEHACRGLQFVHVTGNGSTTELPCFVWMCWADCGYVVASFRNEPSVDSSTLLAHE